MTNPHKGSSLDEFLATEGLLDQVSATARQRVTDWLAKQDRYLTDTVAAYRAAHLLTRLQDRLRERLAVEGDADERRHQQWTLDHIASTSLILGYALADAHRDRDGLSVLEALRDKQRDRPDA